MRSLLFFHIVLVSLGGMTSSPAQTFSFEQAETTIYYSNQDSIYSFHGSVRNLLPETRTLVYTLTPVAYPDTARQSAVCTYLGCYPPRSGVIVIEQEYAPDQVDDSVKFYIYNTRCDWTPGWCAPELAPIVGDHICEVSVHSAANPSESVSFVLSLLYGGGGVRLVSTLVPESAALISAYPNPFNGQTRIRFGVSVSGPVSLDVFDLTGRHVAVLSDRSSYSPGEYELSWNAISTTGEVLPSGQYWLRLASGGAFSSRPIILIR